MPSKTSALTTTKKAAYGRKLPERKQILAMASLLGPEITNLALGQVGGQGVPLTAEPSEVTVTRGVLSQILSEMSATVLARINEVNAQGGVAALTGDERVIYFDLLATQGADISNLESRWEKISGFDAQRQSRAALVSAVTAAVVEAVTPSVQVQTENKTQTHSNKVDSLIFEMEDNPGPKKLTKESALDSDFDL